MKVVPKGLEDFTELRKANYYYVDKTGLVSDLLDGSAKVTLFTRPRRFGKTLNMTMLRDFFSPESDKSVFDGLEILSRKDLCDKYMGRIPVIFISLKDVEGLGFTNAFSRFKFIISGLASSLFTKDDIQLLNQGEGTSLNRLMEGCEDITEQDITNSLYLFTKTMFLKHNIKPIVIIDEYDVPLAKAHANGYWDEMLSIMRMFYSISLKSNQFLERAVLTGCLKVARESVFTGLNNLDVLTVNDDISADRFGFTDAEMHSLLDYFNLSDRWDTFKEWYDGYLFGNVEIWCPWDVLSYTAELCANTDRKPSSHWVNTSGNDWLYDFIALADQATKEKIESLMDNGTVPQRINYNITYQDLGNSIDNLWSLLYMTGYLTTDGRNAQGEELLRIPDKAVKLAFEQDIRSWFDSYMENPSGRELVSLFLEGNPVKLRFLLNRIFSETISIRDYSGRGRKENFYQGMLLGLLSATLSPLAELESNQEAGNGFADIMFHSTEGDVGIIIELKHADTREHLENETILGMQQINDRKYPDRMKRILLPNATIRKYAIAFHHKECMILMEEE